jgi:hypothetical protein
MSGPRDSEVHLPAAKWWFAISRDMFTKTQRNQTRMHRPPVSCNWTPRFSRPLEPDTQR